MKVAHFGGEHRVELDDLRELFAIRFSDDGVGSFNEFWFFHHDVGASTLAVMVADELAFLTYFGTEDGHPGFVSWARGDSPVPDGLVAFRSGTPGQVTETLADYVVSVDDALLAVRDFFACSAALPPSLEWFEL